MTQPTILSKLCAVLLCTSSMVMFSNLLAQSEPKMEIQISSVHKRHHRIYYSNELKFSSNDSSIWFRKNDHRKFKELKENVPSLFSDEVTFQSLDSIFAHLQDYPRPQFYKKSELYRIQLIDHSLTNGMVLTKTLEIPYSPNGNEDFLSTLIAEYRELIII